MMAALHFSIAIRLSLESAGAILEAIGDRQELPLQLVRGDALHALGLEADAGKAYQSVASALAAPNAVEPSSAVDSAPTGADEPLAEPEPAAEAAPEPPAEPAAEPEPEPEPAAEAAPEPAARPALSDLPPLRWD
jgi:hypothetical protein